jgi:lipopolysaccharide/colanic/teichoic acid biosynthesis glycosyltransferase
MRLWPVIFDCQPPFLRSRSLSLLSVALGANTLIDHLRRRLESFTTLSLLVVCPGGTPLEEYRDHVLTSSARSLDVCTPEGFADTMAGHELSDALLILDTRSVPVRDLELSRLVEHYGAEPRAVHHLVVFDTGSVGTKERVSFDPSGQVRAIRRHYDPMTWPFISGVSATILPVACGVMAERLVPHTLAGLRRTLATRGTPTRDVPIEAGAFDFTTESGLLAANEHYTLAASSTHPHGSRDGQIYVGGGQSVDPTARVIGPVVIHAGARVEEYATVVGPAVVGAGARVASGAFVAQAVVGPGCVVPARAVVHDRAWFEVAEREASQPLDWEPPIAQTDPIERARISRDAEHLAWGGSASRRYLQVKRLLDAAVAGLALVLLFPLLLAIGLLIAVNADGPVFYGDEREGLNGRDFKCWKFRTMSDRAHGAQKALNSLDQVDGPHFKVARDPRVTRLGRILRATNLDELPQLWNVARGEMSLVGPRPSPFRENQVCVPWREARISVRPGITGLWQLCRHDREAGDFHQWIEYDVLYVQHMSFLLDAKIIAGTLLTLGGKLTHFEPSQLIRTSDVPRDVSDRPAA